MMGFFDKLQYIPYLLIAFQKRISESKRLLKPQRLYQKCFRLFEHLLPGFEDSK